eukprot:22319-Eustigmatos_ZCMA.PRE.1
MGSWGMAQTRLVHPPRLPPLSSHSLSAARALALASCAAVGVVDTLLSAANPETPPPSALS